MKMRYSELFYSIQGEGRYTGVPSIFLRMFGCNFRCKNFGRYKEHVLNETHNPEVVEIIKKIDSYATYEDLPLVSTGCDSYASVYPEFKRFAKDVTSAELANNIVDLLPNKKWQQEHLVITGGEPLLGWQKAFPSLLDQPCMQDLLEITFETNGTQLLKEGFDDYLDEWSAKHPKREVTFSVSPKLSCSGEKWEEAIRPEVIAQYQKHGYTYLKFVVTTKEDVMEAKQAVQEYRKAGFDGQIYLMPVGGTEHLYYMNNQQVAQLAMRMGWRYSPRLQVDLFSNQWGT